MDTEALRQDLYNAARMNAHRAVEAHPGDAENASLASRNYAQAALAASQAYATLSFRNGPTPPRR